jgi:hypothetical protein
MTAQLAAEALRAADPTGPIHLIWSNKQHAWWGPNGGHYTQDVWEAGRWTLEGAEKAAAIHTWAPGKRPPEVVVIAPESGRVTLTVDEFRMAEHSTRRLAEEITHKGMADRRREQEAAS